jgi:release factor glutamine methyltransferase
MKKRNTKVLIIFFIIISFMIVSLIGGKTYYSSKELQVEISNNREVTINSKKYNTDVKFINNDMLDGITDKFDVIISNPPYISIDEQIMDVVKNNEPSLALYASNNGLYFYDKILSTCKKNLNDNFFIAFEIGQTQSLAIIELTNKYLSNVDVWSEKDLNGLDRYIFIKSK